MARPQNRARGRIRRPDGAATPRPVAGRIARVTHDDLPGSARRNHPSSISASSLAYRGHHRGVERPQNLEGVQAHAAGRGMDEHRCPGFGAPSSRIAYHAVRACTGYAAPSADRPSFRDGLQVPFINGRRLLRTPRTWSIRRRAGLGGGTHLSPTASTMPAHSSPGTNGPLWGRRVEPDCGEHVRELRPTASTADGGLPVSGAAGPPLGPDAPWTPPSGIRQTSCRRPGLFPVPADYMDTCIHPPLACKIGLAIELRWPGRHRALTGLVLRPRLETATMTSRSQVFRFFAVLALTCRAGRRLRVAGCHERVRAGRRQLQDR